MPISVSTQRCRSPCLLNGADLRVYSTVPTQRCRSPCLLNGADLRVYSTCADLRVYSTVPISVSTQRCRSPCLLNVCRPSECDAHAVEWRPIGVYIALNRPRDIALKIGPDRPRSAEIGRDGQRSAEIGRDRHSTVDPCVDVALSMCRLSTGNRQIECRLSPEMQAIGR